MPISMDLLGFPQGAQIALRSPPRLLLAGLPAQHAGRGHRQGGGCCRLASAGGGLAPGGAHIARCLAHESGVHLYAYHPLPSRAQRRCCSASQAGPSQKGLSEQTTIEKFVHEFAGVLQYQREVEAFAQGSKRCSDRDVMGQGME